MTTPDVCPAVAHEALKASSRWDELPRLEKHGGVTEDADGGLIEWKNCFCGSTLIKRIVAPANNATQTEGI